MVIGYSCIENITRTDVIRIANEIREQAERERDFLWLSPEEKNEELDSRLNKKEVYAYNNLRRVW